MTSLSVFTVSKNFLSAHFASRCYFMIVYARTYVVPFPYGLWSGNETTCTHGRHRPRVNAHRAEFLANRLQVGPLSSTIQLSPPSDWRDEARAKRRCKSIRHPLAANFVSGVGACEGIIQAPSPCNRSSSIFDARAARAYGRLPGTIRIYTMHIWF